ncbi:MAG: hypothetical protein ACYC3X_31380 [Pirellulaceae bacterium]
MAEEKIKAALGARADVDFRDTPLRQAAADIADRHQINVMLDDRRTLEEVSVDPETPVTLHLSGVSLESSLTLMLRPLQLTWVVYEGTLLITTPEEAEQILITKVYDVGDLVKYQDKDGKEWADYDTLIMLITSMIQPASWDEVGGPGAIEAAPLGGAEMLTIVQSYHIHRRIDELLKAFREIIERTSGHGLPIREQPTGSMMGGMGMGGGMGSGMGMGGVWSMPHSREGLESKGADASKEPPAED